jgi:uncharacterized membrane protein
VGSILVLLTAVPGVGAALGIIGFILILVAIKNISDVVADKSIFNNMILAVVLAIAGIAAGTLVVIGSVLSFIGLNNLTNLGPNFNPSTVPVGDWVALVGTIIAGLAVVWVMLLASAIFVRRSYGSIASKLNVGKFRTAGLVYLIGAATTIILVGFLLLFVAQILLAVAFFSIDERVSILAPNLSQAPQQIAARP